jgi:hypothetical protein
MEGIPPVGIEMRWISLCSTHPAIAIRVSLLCIYLENKVNARIWAPPIFG